MRRVVGYGKEEWSILGPLAVLVAKIFDCPVRLVLYGIFLRVVADSIGIPIMRVLVLVEGAV